MSEKSLQINISCVDDAKKVIANLASIKEAYDAHGCTSIELVISEEVATPTARILVGAFPWCTHYRKLIKPIDRNVLFVFPEVLPAAKKPGPDRSQPPGGLPGSETDENAPKAPKPNRYLRNLPDAQSLGKSAALVQSPQAGAP